MITQLDARNGSRGRKGCSGSQLCLLRWDYLQKRTSWGKDTTSERCCQLASEVARSAALNYFSHIMSRHVAISEGKDGVTARAAAFGGANVEGICMDESPSSFRYQDPSEFVRAFDVVS